VDEPFGHNANPTGTPPTINLTAPTPDQYGNVYITSPTAVTGSVSDDHNGVSYTVTVIPFDGGASFQLASGSTTTNNTLTLSNVTFDPTMLANGDYTLEVRATDTDDNITTVLDRTVNVSAKLKLGRETLSVTDLTILVAGVPLTVTQTFSLTSPPSGMTINSTTGLVSWSSPVAGTYTITVVDTDAGNGQGDNSFSATQVYTLTVRSSDSGASITTPPNGTVTLGNTYRYDVQATDSDGDPLTYALTGTVPSGMTIDPNTGRILWTPTATGTSSGITVTVTDSFNVSRTSPAFSVTVSADTTAPTVELLLSANPVTTGTKVTFLVFATDNVAVTSLSLTVGTTNLTIDSKGQAFMTMNTIGNFSVIASAKDAAGNTGTAPTQTLKRKGGRESFRRAHKK
jgi:hypothetical protein